MDGLILVRWACGALTAELRMIKTNSARQDLSASLMTIGWLNGTLDAVAKCVDERASRDAALILLILHRNPKARSGEKLIQAFRAWRVARTSKAVEESFRVAMGQLLRSGLITVADIGLTDRAEERIRLMRQTIAERLDIVRRGLSPRNRKLFDKLIKSSLPLPPPKLTRRSR
jgi:hypothetical protein